MRKTLLVLFAVISLTGLTGCGGGMGMAGSLAGGMAKVISGSGMQKVVFGGIVKVAKAGGDLFHNSGAQKNMGQAFSKEAEARMPEAQAEASTDSVKAEAIAKGQTSVKDVVVDGQAASQAAVTATETVQASGQVLGDVVKPQVVSVPVLVVETPNGAQVSTPSEDAARNK